jgi:hypothetical protein
MTLRKQLILCWACVSMPCFAALVAAPGMQPISVIAPQYPVNYQQCGEFSATAFEYSKTLSKVHDDCVQKNIGGPGNSGKCSARACEGFHLARDSFVAQVRDEASQCYAKVSAAKEEMANSIRSASSIEEIQRKILSGPKRLIVARAKEEFAALFSQTANALVRTGVDKTLLMNQTWAGYQRIRSACISGATGKDAAICETQAMLSLHQFGNRANEMSGVNPAIILFRRGIAERTNMIHDDVLTKLPESFAQENAEGKSLGM